MPTPDIESIEAERERIRAEHLRPAAERPVSTARGLHHTALISSDVETTVRFYQGVLGFPLTELIDNRDYPGSSHFFFDIGHGNLLAFFDFPGLDVGPYAEVLGGLHHCAISVDPAHWDELVGSPRGGRRRPRGAQRSLGLLPRPRRRPDRADRGPPRRDVRAARPLTLDHRSGRGARPAWAGRRSGGATGAAPRARIKAARGARCERRGTRRQSERHGPASESRGGQPAAPTGRRTAPPQAGRPRALTRPSSVRPAGTTPSRPRPCSIERRSAREPPGAISSVISRARSGPRVPQPGW